MDGIKRNLHARIETLLEDFPVVAILGSRQTGKTTLSKQLRPDWKYIDLENPRDFDYVSHDPLLFFEQNPSQVIIDEAQLHPEIFNVLRGVIDNNRTQPNRFILTGSSSPFLIESISETLAGRIAYIELPPLKANERFCEPLSDFYKIFTMKDPSVFEFENLKTLLTLNNMRSQWLQGGYPEPVLKDDMYFWSEWMQQYRDSYLNRDMARLFPGLNIINYRRFLQMLAKLAGTIINKSDLARNIEVSQPTITQYINIAQDTVVWRNLQSYQNNYLKSLIKMPKGMIRDSGLLHFLLKIHDLDSLMSDPIVGLSFESFIIEELIRGIQAVGGANTDYYFYRTKHGAEIDLIVEGPNGLLPIEIKYGSHTPAKKLVTLQEFIDKMGLKIGIVINNADKVQQLTTNIIQVPANYI